MADPIREKFVAWTISDAKFYGGEWAAWQAAYHSRDTEIAEAVEALERIRDFDMPKIDELCKLAGVHPFDLMRKDLTELIAGLKGVAG